MTCIIGVELVDRVILAGETISHSTGFVDASSHPKVFKKGEIVIGYSTSFRYGQILECADIEISAPKNPDHIFKWLVTSIVPDFKKALKDAGYEGDGNALIGVGNQLWCLQSDYSVIRSMNYFNVIGSGYPYAYGAIETYRQLNPPTSVEEYEEMLRFAIKVAAKYCPSTNHVLDIISTKD